MLSLGQNEVIVPVEQKMPIEVALGEGVPATVEDVIIFYKPKLEEALKSVSPEKLAEAKAKVDKLLQGDLSWADFSQYTPERMSEICEIGFRQFTVGNYESAERIFKGLTVIDPNNYYYHQMMGAILQRRDQHSEAIVEYAAAVRLNPEDIVSRTNRGEVYFKLGLYDLAHKDFEEAVRLDTTGKDKWSNRARMLREQIKLIKSRKK